ncbi:MAG TPA: hypothetical protein VFW40_08000, partial [Capsulimonadaceae bacterium]|nr:hypothetical protein [Capsulimonadaceae bacterium]
MSDRSSPLDKLKSWLGRAPAAPRYGSVYLKDGTYYFFHCDEDVTGYVRSCPPIQKQPASIGDQELGSAVIESLALCKRGVPKPADPREAIRPLLAALKLPSWDSFTDGACQIGVVSDGKTITVTPNRMDTDGSFLPDIRNKETVPARPEPLGRKVREILQRLEAETETVKVKARKTEAKAAKTTKKTKATPGGSTIQGFGYKIAWLALKTVDSQEVARALGHKNYDEPVPCSWDDGLEAAYAGEGLFISPPVDGWILAAGDLSPTPEEEGFLGSLEDLSRQFGEAQYFINLRIAEYFGWSKARNGALVRAYAWLGERGEIVLDRGQMDDAESGLGLTRAGHE